VVASIQSAQSPNAEFVLPVLVFGITEVHRVTRELNDLEDYFTQTELRKTIEAAPVPKTSRSLEALAVENNCDLVKAADRKLLLAFLKGVIEKAPRIHISFSSDPSAAFTGKVVEWFRRNTSPIVLVQVGLQPTIAAGCVLRTPNKMFDFSLRQRFEVQRALLATSLQSGTLHE
jgi:hypothetical protein